VKRKRPIGLIALVTVFILASFYVVTIFARNWVDVFAGHSDLRGEIHAERRSLHVEDIIQLELTLPERFQSVYRLHWEVDPPSAGTIDYAAVTEDDRVVDEDGNVSYPSRDRTAYFTAETPGRCAVEVYGFYRQTNPRFITRLELAITP
jgi:hypothetical protein